MKKFVDVLVSVLVCASIFTLISYLRIKISFEYYLLIFIIVFYFAGFNIRLFYNSRHQILSFSITLLTLLIFVNIITDFHEQAAIVSALVPISYILGYMWPKLKSAMKISMTILIFGLYFFSVFYFMPLAGFHALSVNRGDLQNKPALKFFQDAVLKDTADNNINNFFEEDKVYLVEFYFRNCSPCIMKERALKKLRKEIPDTSFQIIYIQNGGIDDFEIYQLTCRENGNEGNRYYDVKGSLASIMKIEGFPFELIIDKKRIVRKVSVGFDSGFENLYLKNEKSVISILLDEK